MAYAIYITRLVRSEGDGDGASMAYTFYIAGSLRDQKATARG